MGVVAAASSSSFFFLTEEAPWTFGVDVLSFLLLSKERCVSSIGESGGCPSSFSSASSSSVSSTLFPLLISLTSKSKKSSSSANTSISSASSTTSSATTLSPRLPLLSLLYFSLCLSSAAANLDGDSLDGRRRSFIPSTRSRLGGVRIGEASPSPSSEVSSPSEPSIHLGRGR